MNAADPEPSEPSAPGAVARLTQFGRLLRDNGVSTSAAEIADAVRYLARPGADIDALSERRLRAALKALYCKRRSELERFDELFDAYWNDRVGRKRTMMLPKQGGGATVQTGSGPQGSGGAGGGLASFFEWGSADAASADEDAAALEDGAQTRLGGASNAASRGQADFGKTTDPEERERLLLLAERLGARMRFRLARRRRDRARGAGLNLKRTFRRSLATGGVPITLVRTQRREPPVRLALFIDVSGSMDAYSMFFMRFVHALTGRFANAEAFLFHTRLVHISGALREADPMKMMEKITLISQGWSGGTRIGEAIETFNAQYADAYGGSRAVAIVMSDGYDTGGPDRLAAALTQLRRRVGRILWLNPMLGREGYAPETRAMAGALPHLDLFAPAHNLDSLAALENALVRA